VSVFDLDGLLSAEVRGLQAPSSDGGHKDVVRWARVRRSGERTRLEVDCGKMSFRAVSARVSVVLPYEWRSMLAAAREPTL
jgi:hypothetical protein